MLTTVILRMTKSSCEDLTFHKLKLGFKIELSVGRHNLATSATPSPCQPSSYFSTIPKSSWQNRSNGMSLPCLVRLWKSEYSEWMHFVLGTSLRPKWQWQLDKQLRSQSLPCTPSWRHLGPSSHSTCIETVCGLVLFSHWESNRWCMRCMSISWLRQHNFKKLISSHHQTHLLALRPMTCLLSPMNWAAKVCSWLSEASQCFFVPSHRYRQRVM